MRITTDMRKSVTVAFQEKCRGCANRCVGAFDEKLPLKGYHCFSVIHGGQCRFKTKPLFTRMNRIDYLEEKLLTVGISNDEAEELKELSKAVSTSTQTYK